MADLGALATDLDAARASVRTVLRPPFAEAATEARAAAAALAALYAAGRIDTAEASATEAAEAESLRGELRAALAEAIPLAEHSAAPPGATPAQLAEALARAGYPWRPGDPVVPEAAWPVLPGWEGDVPRVATPLRRPPAPGFQRRPHGSAEALGAVVEGWTVTAPTMRPGWAVTLDAAGRSWRLWAPGGGVRVEGAVVRAAPSAVEAVSLAPLAAVTLTLPARAHSLAAGGDTLRAELTPGDGAAEVRVRLAALRQLLSRLDGATARGWASALAPLAASLDARGGLDTREAQVRLRAARAYEVGAALLAAFAPSGA